MWIQVLLALHYHQAKNAKKSGSPSNSLSDPGAIGIFTPESETKCATETDCYLILERYLEKLPIDLAVSSLGELLTFVPPKAAASNTEKEIYKFLMTTTGMLLSKCVTRPNGVPAVIHYILDKNDPQESRTTSVCVKIMCVPPQWLSLSEYYQNIANQVRPAFLPPAEPALQPTIYHKIVWELVKKMLELQPQIGKQFFIDPFISPFLTFQDGSRSDHSSESSEQILVQETQLEDSVDFLKGFLCETQLSQALLRLFTPVIPALFQLYCFTQKSSISRLKTPLEEIIRVYFRLCDEANGVFKSLILPENGVSYFLSSNTSKIFAPGETGGVVIKQIPTR